MKKIIKKWLGLDMLEARIETLESLVLDPGSRLNGFAILKEHLQPQNHQFNFKTLNRIFPEPYK